MFGSNTIEIAIGLIVVFILFSTVVTAVREGIESFLKTRAAYLEHGIRLLLSPAGSAQEKLDENDKPIDIVEVLYNHPLINSLYNSQYSNYAAKYLTKKTSSDAPPSVMANGGNLPSYIPSKNFARAILDIAANGAKGADLNLSSNAPILSLATIRSRVKDTIPIPDLQRSILNAIDTAQGDMDKAQKNLENWYNSSMDRVSGWYKRSTQYIIFGVGLAAAIALNINTISIINYLSTNDTARKVIVAQAEKISKDSTVINENYAHAQEKLDELKIPMGWPMGLASAQLNPKEGFGVFNTILGPLFGWLITALAGSLGAPYWFDLLNKVMVIRSTVKPHEKSLEEGSQDAQPKTQTVAPAPVVNLEVAAAADPAQANVAAISGDDIDSCDIRSTDDVTPDDELPETKGGVA